MAFGSKASYQRILQIFFCILRTKQIISLLSSLFSYEAVAFILCSSGLTHAVLIEPGLLRAKLRIRRQAISHTL